MEGVPTRGKNGGKAGVSADQGTARNMNLKQHKTVFRRQ